MRVTLGSHSPYTAKSGPAARLEAELWASHEQYPLACRNELDRPEAHTARSCPCDDLPKLYAFWNKLNRQPDFSAHGALFVVVENGRRIGVQCGDNLPLPLHVLSPRHGVLVDAVLNAIARFSTAFPFGVATRTGLVARLPVPKMCPRCRAKIVRRTGNC